MSPSVLARELAVVEDAVLRADWERALTLAKTSLRRTVDLRAAGVNCDDSSTSNTIALEEETMLGMYLESIFELNREDEVDEALMLHQALGAMSFETQMQWINFLIGMNRHSQALEAINDVLLQRSEQIAAGYHSTKAMEEYVRTTELLVFQLLLGSGDSNIASAHIVRDPVLHDDVKQSLLDMIHAQKDSASLASIANRDSEERRDVPSGSSAAPSTQSTTALEPVGHSTQRNSSRTRSPQPSAVHLDSDPSSDLVTIGGTVLAAAVMAIGVFRYKDRLREAAESIGPALSKGLADAKYALFES